MPIAVWDAATVALTTRLWGEGYSAGHIAMQLKNISRNAILGKLYRLRVQTHGRNPIHTVRPQQKAKPTARTKRMSDEIEFRIEAEQPGNSPVEYLAMEEHHCRALLDERGSDGLFLCCGRTRLRNRIGGWASSYCPRHDREYSPGRYTRGHYGALGEDDRYRNHGTGS